MGFPGMFMIISSVCTGLFLAYKADKIFGCVTGDIMGSSNEIARVVSIIIALIILNFI